MKKREANFGTEYFAPYVRRYGLSSSEPVETKQTTEDYISFSVVPEHQLDALQACKTEKGFLYKISDQSVGHKPFDYVYYCNCKNAWIVIKFPAFFCFFDVDVFIKEKESSTRKSLTAERARELSPMTIDI